MIEIIKHGAYSKCSYEIECRFCKCYFAFNEFDIRRPEENIKCKQVGNERWVECPECHADNSIILARRIENV